MRAFEETVQNIVTNTTPFSFDHVVILKTFALRNRPINSYQIENTFVGQRRVLASTSASTGSRVGLGCYFMKNGRTFHQSVFRSGHLLKPFKLFCHVI